MLFVASDHAGFKLKSLLLQHFISVGIECNDLGPASDGAMDYPDMASLLCKNVKELEDSKGILICGSGIGMSIAANRYEGIRAALCLNPYMASLARQHNNANVLCLGSRLLGEELAVAIADSFLSCDFEEGRHRLRIEKLDNAKKLR